VHGLDGAVRDMALLFGSSKAPHNSGLQSLETLMAMICGESCDDVIKLTGLK
jgi:hypothetical protein